MFARGAARWLTVASLLTVLDLGYLAWRYIALKAGLVTPHTGLCSWTGGIDCDAVLATPEARAFYFPNATLGLGFYVGCFLWWWLCQPLGPAYRRLVAGLLGLWLAVAALVTFRLFWLLFHLPVFCPFCPWNHTLSYIMLVSVAIVWWRAPATAPGLSWRPLVRPIAICVGQLLAWQVGWLIALRAGLLQP